MTLPLVVDHLLLSIIRDGEGKPYYSMYRTTAAQLLHDLIHSVLDQDQAEVDDLVDCGAEFVRNTMAYWYGEFDETL